jgi:anti-repressor protein
MMKNSFGRNAKAKCEKMMAADVVVFENPEFGKVRTLTDKQGEPWFCGKDLCDVLGYKRPDHAVNQHVDEFDVLKQDIKLSGRFRKDGTRTERLQQVMFVNESGFYALLFGSKLPAARMFKRWVTAEVLPQIRKNGCYQLQQDLEIKEKLIGEKEKLIGEQDVEIRRLNDVVGDQVVRLVKGSENILTLERQVDDLLPKALYSDNVLDSISCYTTTQVAKELGITAQELNRSLCALHIQYYQSGQYMLYAEYAHKGLAKSRTHFKSYMAPASDGRSEKVGRVNTHTYLVWTEKGRKFIHDLAHRFWELAELYEVKNL